MCGRFTLITDLEVLTERFNFNYIDEEKIKPQFNIAPTDNVLTITNDGYRNKAVFLKWGLVPSKMINARVETIDTKPTFKFLLERKRCLILADGFYEWKKINGLKQPYRIILKSKEPFAFAGLWDNNTCTIITSEANKIVRDIHERMPVILAKENESKWLDHSLSDLKYIKKLLYPYPEELMTAYKVPSAVNSSKVNSEECIQEID